MPRVLVVEDDFDVRVSVVSLLEDEGFTVVHAANGLEALKALQAGARPCVILLDLMMPIMDGYAFRAAQSQDPLIAPIPVVVLSAAADARQQAKVLGVRDFLAKPIELNTLLNTIERYC